MKEAQLNIKKWRVNVHTSFFYCVKEVDGGFMVI